MAFDGIVISNLTHELKSTLCFGRISKIAMPENNELQITIKNNSNNYKLLISADASLPLMYLTEINKQSPLTAPVFCMLLRKHIGSARITNIEQIGLERIVRFELEHLNELGDVCQKYLYIELMGKYSNIIFTDTENTIIDSIKRISAQVSSLREVLPGRKYMFPEQLQRKDPLSLTLDDFKTIFAVSKPVGKTLYSSLCGISPIVSEEICNLSNVDSDICITQSDIEKINALYTSINKITNRINSCDFTPHIILHNGTFEDFSSIPLTCIENGEAYSIKTYDSISKLLYDYYSTREANVRIKQKSSDLRKVVSTALERVTKKYDLQSKQMKDTEKKDKYKVYGDLIHTYGYELSGGEKKITCKNYYDNDSLITISLDENLDASANAKKYYDRYAKLKRTQEALTDEIRKTMESIEHLSSVLTSLDLATDEADLSQIKQELVDFGYLKRHITGKKHETSKSKPLHYKTADGIDIYVGKNNYQNEELSFKLATGNDWWFHAKGIPGSHVIVKANNMELSDNTYEIAAGLAAYYSKDRTSDKVEVDYIQKKNLKKVAGAAPGFVIYHTNWSMVATPTIDKSLVLV